MKHIGRLLCVLFFPLTAPAQSIDAKAVDAHVEEALKAFQVPGAAVAIVQEDQVVYFKGHGVRELGSDQAVMPDTLFAIASVTKSFTAAAVAVQVDDGTMAWDDPVRKHLDYFRLADPLAREHATLRDLRCQRTGLASHPYLWADPPWGREELLRQAAEDKVTNKVRADTSSPKSTMVTVAPGVQLEVLDWGGTGEPMVLLTGLGDNAHVYDQFAHQFTDKFHVIGITRRGFGRSSQPADGYDVDTRARDDIKVLDHLHIRQAVLVGHSIAGSELSKIGEVYPDRVKKLVYLDGLDTASGGWATLRQPPPAPEPTAADLESVQRLAAAWARSDGYRKPLAAICDFVRTDPSGKVVDTITPPGISKKIYEGLQPANYDRIKAPALGIFNAMTPQYRLAYYEDLDRAKQEDFDRSIKQLAKWTTGAIQRFRSGVKNTRVVELPDSNHYAFITDEARVVREMRKFLLDK